MTITVSTFNELLVWASIRYAPRGLYVYAAGELAEQVRARLRVEDQGTLVRVGYEYDIATLSNVLRFAIFNTPEPCPQGLVNDLVYRVNLAVRSEAHQLRTWLATGELP